MSLPKDFHSVTSQLRAAANTAADDVRADHFRALEAQIDAIARGDLVTVLQHACEDVTLEIFVPPEFPFTRFAVGAEAFRQAIAHNFAAVSNQTPTVVDVFSEGHKVVLFGRETGTIRATGRSYDIEFVQRFTFRGGRLAAVQIIGAYARPVGD